MYTIKRAAELTGIPEATLRAWERRYGIVTPSRTPAGYRLYDQADLDLLSGMNSLLSQGVSARQAAAMAREDSGRPAMTGRVPPEPPASAPPVDPLSLTSAASRLDPSAISAVLDDGFSRGSFESVVDGWLMPSLAEIGRAWASGTLSVAAEHLVVAAVQRRLAAAYEASGDQAPGHGVLVGLVPGSRHELGALAFAVAARRAGVPTLYLGPDLPVRDWVDAVGGRGAGAVVTSLSCQSDSPALADWARTLRARYPQLLVAVGGGFQNEAPAGCLRLGHGIGEAARWMATELSRRVAPRRTGVRA